MVPGVIALLAIYVRATCPESPYWVRAQDRKRQIAATVAAGAAVDAEDRAWFAKAGSVGIRQVFLPDVLPATMVALFVGCSSCRSFGTVGGWMPYYLDREGLVDSGVQRLLRMLGHRRLFRPMAGGLAR